jgi:DNA-binding transcriptional LysR family regulator
MDLRQLDTLRAVAEAGSFTRAATRLHVSQSAVSRQIQLLEKEFDEQLFLRTGRSIRITPAGSALLALSRRVFEDINQTSTNVREGRRHLSGTIRLVGGMTACLHMYPTLIAEFQRAFPDVDVRVTPGARARILQKLRQGTADLGLLTLPVDDPSLACEPVMREELVFVTSPFHALTRRAEVRPADLADLSFVMIETGSKTRLVIDDFFAREHLSPKIATETDNVEIIKALVRQGVGVTIVPYQAVAREVQSGQLHATRIAGHQLVREIGWVHVRSQKLPRTVVEMKNMLLRVRGKLQLAPAPTAFSRTPAAAVTAGS